MNRLVQDDKDSVVYGTFRGESNQELFRCPRELDDVDLKNYVNTNRCMLGFETDNMIESLKDSPNYIGYYRLYFRDNNWYGRWMEENEDCDQIACHGVDEIIEWLKANFTHGCDWEMEEYLRQFPIWGYAHRYVLKPKYSDKYKVLFDTTYGNGDYPVRIYIYKQAWRY